MRLAKSLRTKRRRLHLNRGHYPLFGSSFCDYVSVREQAIFKAHYMLAGQKSLAADGTSDWERGRGAPQTPTRTVTWPA
jgi:hypothetical protein